MDTEKTRDLRARLSRAGKEALRNGLDDTRSANKSVLGSQLSLEKDSFLDVRTSTDNVREPELVRLVLASQSSTGCSSEDEGVAEMHETTSESLLTINPTSDVPLQSPISPTASLVAITTPSDDTNVLNDSNSTTAFYNMLSLPPIDRYVSEFQIELKHIVSLAQLKQRIVDSSKGAISKNGPMAECERLAEMKFANIHVKHNSDEFFTFCSCNDCIDYREMIMVLIVDQFKTQHVVVRLVDALLKVYKPMLKNATACNKFEKLLHDNKEIYWLISGTIYDKIFGHMHLIDDKSLSDNMILVLFSGILFAKNPMLLLQILSFQVECIVKAYAEGFLEIVDPENNKIPAEEMLKYILDGFDELCRISLHVSCYLFAFELDFLRKFSLTWVRLCQRLYQQHVYFNLTDTMLACIITLKEDELTACHAELIRKYILFDENMFYLDKGWNDIWIKLNRFNLSEEQRKGRARLLEVHRIFETIAQNALELSLSDYDRTDDNVKRQLAWQNMMAYMKMKWPDGFFDPPNNVVCEDKCKRCNVLLEYHAESCKCITCSIAGGPLPPKRNADGTCYKCLALLLVEKEVTFYESKILNVCANDDFLLFIKNNEKRKSTTLEELGEDVNPTLASGNKCNIDDQESIGTYHLAWAVFRHLNNREKYKYSSIEQKYFCSKCKFQACRLARKILNNEIEFALSLHLIKYYHPLSMSGEEVRSILPNIMLCNRKIVSSNNAHDLVGKIYCTFVISVYATYFIEFDNDCQLSLEYFELINNDISLKTERIVGNKNDTKFVQFLDKIKSLSNEKDAFESEVENPEEQLDEIQKKLEEILTINENKTNQPLLEYKTPLESNNPTPTESADSNNKKHCRDKSKKCCFDHSDMGDHCIENHSSKKRIKKECNHARMNETRDRLRKKLSQLVNARKNMKTSVDQQAHQSTKINQPPSLKTAATVAASSASQKITDADSLECLNTLCKRISHLNAGKSNASEPENLNLQKKLNMNSSSTRTPCNSDLGKESCSKNVTKSNSQERDKSTGSTARNRSDLESTGPKKTGNGLDMVNEIYELLGTNSKDQLKVKKWINETLSYIEGSSGNGNGKQQPQPTSAKKAAKKAKQKQRKEEEKRVAELQDLRSQFHDIYFKEFFDKHELIELKTSKKRDKKKITEIEANIKNLQRAKAKVESAILELIATVKLSNSEFKFSYLPTKEQQLEKLKRANTDKTNTQNLPTNEAVKQEFLISSVQTTTNLNPSNIATGNYSLPYAHANNFPYHIDLQSPVIGSPSTFNMIRPSLPTPMCYAPPQHQPLSPEVVAAMAANVDCNSTNDPSKRIVTIRRVNLPNVPEPQVTVTAKGSSPDKDKLLYTFVNGQLVQTETSIPHMTQIPGNPLSMQMQGNNVQLNKPVKCPPQPLSKTQMKKERRRLAQKAAEEAEAALEIERQKLRDKELELQKRREEEELLKKSKKKVKSKTNDKLQQLKRDLGTGNSSTKSKKKRTTIVSSPSTTSVSTADAGDCGASNSSTTSTRRRSSSELSGSALHSSLTSLSSQVNTRDNSICSHNPTMTNNSKNGIQTKHNSQSRKQEKKGVKETIQKKSTKKVLAPITPLPPATPVENDQLECADISTSIRRKVKRNKFIDNGQFDNNPFKSLHMIDLSSDSETSSYDEDDTESVVESIDKKVNHRKEISAKHPTLNKLQKPVQCKKDDIIEKQDKKQITIKVSNNYDAKLQRNEKDIRDKRDTTSQAKCASENSLIFQNKKNVMGQSQDPPKKSLVSAVQVKPQSQEQRNNAVNQQQPLAKKNSNSTSRFDRTSNARSIGPALSTTNISTNTLNAVRSNNRINNRNTIVEQQNKSSDQKPLSKRAQKQAQRSKHKSQKQNTNHSNNNDCYSGIPNNMGYFHSSDFNIPSPQIKQQQNQLQHLKQSHQQQYKAIQQQMQGLHLNSSHQQSSNIQASNNYLVSASDPRLSCEASTSNNNSSAANVSIMDQLNRGVQVENLSLPPGITLTKVDPIKSEMLRKKSESIKKLAKPLQQQSHPAHLPQSFHHPGATIIAPPVATVSGYYGAPYADVAAAAALGQNGVIMLETMPASNTQSMQSKSNVAAAAAAAASNTKSSKSKKRRNKSKNVISSRNMDNAPTATSSGQPKMVTLRNPMFHSGPPGAAAPIMQPPSLIPGRPIGGLPLTAALSMDQPAAIIKNENGMFTIRNPALQQAVASGLAIGGYRQFGNVNYYTPQEAVAEAARATQNAVNSKSCSENTTFSYFSNSSNEQIPQGAVNDGSVEVQPPHDLSRDTHNNISISCTRIEGNGGLVGDSAIIARPSQPMKCISAIGSEIKNAQQQKQKSKETQWTNFGQEIANNTNSSDSLDCGSLFLSGSARSANLNSPLQEKYPHSIYYNGFDVFPANSNSSQISSTGGRSSNTGSLFDSADCHMNHNCGDESPPPTITGFNHYLEGIPNTGVIRYDDASFLKRLMPGQHLNNEVSIHNVNDSNFSRNSTSPPVAHRVEISPVYGNRPTSENIYEHRSTAATNSSTNYRESLSEYSNEDHLFAPNTLLNINEMNFDDFDDVESFKRFNYSFNPPKEKRKVNININDLLLNKNSASNRASPYMDENALESFVQNMNTLQISTPTSTDEQCSQQNSGGASINGSNNNATNGWW